MENKHHHLMRRVLYTIQGNEVESSVFMLHACIIFTNTATAKKNGANIVINRYTSLPFANVLSARTACALHDLFAHLIPSIFAIKPSPSPIWNARLCQVQIFQCVFVCMCWVYAQCQLLHRLLNIEVGNAYKQNPKSIIYRPNWWKMCLNSMDWRQLDLKSFCVTWWYLITHYTQLNAGKAFQAIFLLHFIIAIIIIIICN